MTEFRGVVNIDDRGNIICFCSHEEALQGKCICQKRDDCPEAMISVEVIPGSRPSERGVKKMSKAASDVVKEVNKIKEGLAHLEKSIKKTKFRIR